MRFTEAVNSTQYPQGFLSIPDPEFTAMIETWCKKMGKKTGYRRETRMEHWQEAIDTVYTALEADLQSGSTSRIMEHPKWIIMMLAAKQYFPEHIDLYHPSLVEEQRIGRLIHLSKTRRLIADKIELMRILKNDNVLSVTTLNDIILSRLQCEVLAASAQILAAKARAHSFWEYTTDIGKSSTRERDASAKIVGNGVKASAKAGGTKKAEASFDSGMTKTKLGFKHQVKAAVTAQATGEAHASAEASADRLIASANAGLSYDTSVGANIDYTITRTCKVKTEYLKRIMSDDFKVVEGHAEGSAKAGSWGSAEGKISSSFSHKSHNLAAQEGNFFSTTTDTDANKERFSVIDLNGTAEVELGISLSGRAGVKFLQSAEIELSGDLIAGARAIGELKFMINGRGVGWDFNSAVFAGMEVGTEQKFTLTHPSRKVTIFSISMREAVSLGIGAQARFKGKATYEQIVFDPYAGATVGIGVNAGFDTMVSPLGAFLVAYDLMIVPSILALGRAMVRNDPQRQRVHTQRMETLCKFLNNRASKAEINTVYMECHNRMSTLVSALDSEADQLLSTNRKLRASGYDGYQSATIHDAVRLESSYFKPVNDTRKTPLEIVFGSQADDGDAGITLLGVGAGQRGKTVTQTALQTGAKAEHTGNVKPAKGDLYRLVSEYEKVKNNGSNSRVAFDVLRADLVKSTVPTL
ncbi:Uncharacterised protein [BD1-7 clade bacterium]|nr:Uncharacterised protein [BD1-7 clade bacterium]